MAAAGDHRTGGLAELLANAQQQMKALALTTPAGDNALETLQRVLAAMPTNLMRCRVSTTSPTSMRNSLSRLNDANMAWRSAVDKGWTWRRMIPICWRSAATAEQPAVPALGDAGGRATGTVGPVELA
jgi:hypothetical protein